MNTTLPSFIRPICGDEGAYPVKYDPQVLEKVKSDPHLRQTPVVMLTSSREESDLVRSYELGVTYAPTAAGAPHMSAIHIHPPAQRSPHVVCPPGIASAQKTCENP